MSEAREAPRRSSFPAAVAGGLIGAAVTVAILVFAIPELVAGRLVRAGMMSDPQILVDAGEALRDRPTLRFTGGGALAPTSAGVSCWAADFEPYGHLVIPY